MGIKGTLRNILRKPWQIPPSIVCTLLSPLQWHLCHHYRIHTLFQSMGDNVVAWFGQIRMISVFIIATNISHFALDFFSSIKRHKLEEQVELSSYNYRFKCRYSFNKAERLPSYVQSIVGCSPHSDGSSYYSVSVS